MKNKHFKTNGVIHSITPFGLGAYKVSADGLFDDCPICTELRRDIEAGRATVVEEGEDESEG